MACAVRRRICLAVAVVALRQPRRVQRRKARTDRSIYWKPLRRCTRRYSSQRDEFHLVNQLPEFESGRCGVLKSVAQADGSRSEQPAPSPGVDWLTHYFSLLNVSLIALKFGNSFGVGVCSLY